jgi:excinuclease ABC subunit B
VQPIGPALAELLNPAINRGDSGIGSSTGLQPPPDNSWDRRASGEAAAHRARASTRGTSEGVAARDTSRGAPPPNPPPQAGEGFKRRAPGADETDFSNSGLTSPPPAREARGGEGSGAGGVSASSAADEFAAPPPTPALESELRSPRTPQGGRERREGSERPRVPASEAR